jgi:hypothetical protein
MIKRIKEWMHWRGVTLKDIVCGVFALGTLCALTTFLIYALVVAALG